MFHVPLKRESVFFSGDFLHVLFIKSESRKIDNNAEIKNFVHQLRKTNTQRKT